MNRAWYMRVALWPILVLLVFTGCTVEWPEQEAVYGTYRAEYPFGAELLTLYPGDTFQQTLIVYDNSDTVSYNGSWTYYRDDGSVCLHHGLNMTKPGCEFNPHYADVQNVHLCTTMGWPHFWGAHIRFAASCEGIYLVKIK